MKAKAPKKPAAKKAKKPAAPAPAAQAAPPAAVQVPQPPAMIAPAPAPVAAAGIKVLIIDDDPFIAGMYSTRLMNDGFTIVTAPDGVQGLKLAASEHPDVILLDVLMPRMDGFETLRNLKADPALAGIPVLMLTSMSQPDDVNQGLRLGAADYMLKTNTLPMDASDKIKKVLKTKK